LKTFLPALVFEGAKLYIFFIQQSTSKPSLTINNVISEEKDRIKETKRIQIVLKEAKHRFTKKETTHFNSQNIVSHKDESIFAFLLHNYPYIEQNYAKIANITTFLCKTIYVL